MTTKQLLKTNEVADLFGGVTDRTILNWRKTKGFPNPVMWGFYSKAAVEDWLKKSQEAANA